MVLKRCLFKSVGVIMIGVERVCMWMCPTYMQQHANQQMNLCVKLACPEDTKCKLVIFCSAMEVVLESLVKRAGEATEAAVALQQKYAEATKKHTELLKKAMEDTSDVSA